MCFVCGSIYCMIYFWAFMYAIDVNVFMKMNIASINQSLLMKGVIML